MLQIICCLLLIVFAGCNRNPDQNAAIKLDATPERYQALYQRSREPDSTARANLPYERIALERTPCPGCPVYTVTLERSGKAELIAKSLPRLDGVYTGEVDLSDYGRLCHLMDRLNFVSLQSEYRGPSASDIGSTILTVTTPAGVRTIIEEGNAGPIELWAISQAIDAVRAQIVWRHNEPSPR